LIRGEKNGSVLEVLETRKLWEFLRESSCGESFESVKSENEMNWEFI